MLTDFYIKQGDTLEAITTVLEFSDGTVITRSLSGASVKFHMKDNSGTVLVNRAATILDLTAKRVGYQWITGDTTESSAAATPHQAEFEVTYSDGNIETFPNTGNINVHVFPQVA